MGTAVSTHSTLFMIGILVVASADPAGGFTAQKKLLSKRTLPATGCPGDA